MTILCIASYEKGHEFLREAKRQECSVVLLTSQSLQGKAAWPMESIDEIFFMPDEDHVWNRADTIKAVSYLARTRVIDRIVALDDFDVELAASLREHLRVPGMGETTVRHFRDKLAMRMSAREAGLNVPDFVPVLNYDALRRFMENTPAPWVLKPRSMAGAIGIKKIQRAEELWPAIESLADMQSFYLLEQFVPGDIFHVDCIVSEKQVVFAIASGYGRPPMEVSHGGGIFTTRILERDSDDAVRLVAENQRVMAALGMVRGVSHTEFIKARSDGRIYFLETSARVGGAHIVELVESATGLNLWAEWAKVEVTGKDGGYQPPVPNQDYAALLISLARQQHPDTSAYNDREIVWRLVQDHHAGLIVKSPSAARVRELLCAYESRFTEDFYAYEPPRDKPSH
jgi:glutathione synthase/RimK-type ligase-like ATP-grasp enzyme